MYGFIAVCEIWGSIALLVNIQNIWEVTTHRIVNSYQRFGGEFYLHFQTFLINPEDGGSTLIRNLIFCGPCIVIYLRSKSQHDGIFCSQFIQKVNLYMFRAYLEICMGHMFMLAGWASNQNKRMNKLTAKLYFLLVLIGLIRNFGFYQSVLLNII